MRKSLALLHRHIVSRYLRVAGRVWDHLPAPVRSLSLVVPYGDHLHSLVRRHADRGQSHSTFFFRNRPELELMARLAGRKSHGSEMKLAVIGCSTGAEVYSIVWTIRSARPDLKLSVHAVDVSQEILEFASEGVYSLRNLDDSQDVDYSRLTKKERALWNTHPVQTSAPLFHRMSKDEMEAMFDFESDAVRVKSWLKDGVRWSCGDAGDPELASVLGTHDIVVANRFLCHMPPPAAQRILHNLDTLVRPGGQLFVSGVDADIRTKVATERKWKPVVELIKEIHNGDPSLRAGWPVHYWGNEPFRPGRKDAVIRYASVFQIG